MKRERAKPAEKGRPSVGKVGRRGGNPPPELLLASASPRRRDLLSRAGFGLRVHPVEVDETPRPGESPRALVRRLASLKARTARSRRAPADPEIVLGADTLVVLDDAGLGKPRTKAEAAETLRRLSGRTHRVLTGVCVLGPGGFHRARTVVTTVRFRPLTEREIRAYVESGEPMDKAGAYGIQGLGGALVDALQGSYTNVVGLPLRETLDLLQEAGARRP